MALSEEFRSQQAKVLSGVSLRPLVLVVDPDASARSVLEVALTRDGFDVWSADSGDRALELLNQGRVPEVVVLESDLGGEDGFSVVAELRGSARTPGLGVLVLAGAKDADARDLGEVVGADDIIRKPAFARDVSTLVRMEVRRRHGSVIQFEAAVHPPGQTLRALLSTSRSGRLNLADGRGEAAFRDGEVVDVRWGGRTQLESLPKMLALTRGNYSVHLEPVKGKAPGRWRLPELIHQVMPRLLRWGRAVDRGLPLDARMAVDFPSLARLLATLPDEVNRVVQLFDGLRTVAGVVGDSPFDETLTLEIATRLYLLGAVVPIVADDREELLVLKTTSLELSRKSSEVEDLMHQLGASEVSVIQAGEQRAPDDGTGGWTTRAPAMLTRDLSPDIKEQIHAMNIPLQVEARERSIEERRAQAFLDDPQGTTPPLGLEAAFRSVDPREAIVTPLETPAVDPWGSSLGDDATAPAAEPSVATVSVASAEAAFFASETATDVLDDAKLSPLRRWNGWPFLALVVTALIVAVLFDTMRVGPTPETPPAVSFEPVGPPPGALLEPTDVPDIEDSAWVESAVDVTENLNEAKQLYEAGEYGKAIAVLEQVLGDDPKSVSGWLLMGLAKYDSMNASGARDAVDHVLALDPTNARVQVLLATLDLQAGRREEGQAALRRYLELEPQGQFSEEAKVLLERAGR